ncbi:MAG: YveK family protein, partial [Janthinobacterium lividum]
AGEHRTTRPNEQESGATVGTTMLQGLRRRWWLVLLCALVGLGAGLGAAAVIPRTYTSTTQIYVSLAADATAGDVLNSSTFVEQRAQTYAELVQGEAFERAVGAATSATTTPELSARISDNTVLLAISAVASGAEQAQLEADTAATLLIQRAAQLEARSDGTASLQLRVVETADLPDASGFPTPPVLIALGLIVGIVVGVAATALAARMNSRLRRPADVEDTPMADRVTWLAGLGSSRNEGQRTSTLVAVHRQLVTSAGNDGQAVVVLGCTPDDLATARTVADETAATLSRAGVSVALLLLDETSHRPGLSDLIEGHTPPGAVALPRADAVRVLEAGSKPLRVWTATNAEVESVLRRLLGEVDTVLVVAPPLVARQPYPATAYARAAGAALLVATQGSSARDEVLAALAAAERWNVRSVHALLAPRPSHRRVQSRPADERATATTG